MASGQIFTRGGKRVTDSERIKLYEQAKEKFGVKGQLIKTLEELTELSLEIHRLLENRCGYFSMIEEIADVQIMTEQLMYLTNVKEEVEIVKKEKLQRLKERIKRGGD